MPTCSHAYKEWAGVCRALADGRQTILLRKGGISEGPDGFRPEHPAFWLYPTFVHQAQQGLRDPGPPIEPESSVPIDLFAEVESVAWVDRTDQLAPLEPFHIWTAETVLKRFHYRTPGVWVLGVRIYRADRPHHLFPTPEQSGCMTWVDLDPPLATVGLRPVLDDSRAQSIRDALHGAGIP